MPIPSPTPSLPRAPHGAKPITVSIVSHGQLGLIRPLLEQLDRWSHASVERVVLTVNIPESDEVADLLPQLRFPIERIDNATPKGFGANQNQAFGHCATPWFLVLNPDIRLDADVLAPLVAGAPADSGLLAPRILEPGKSEPEQHRSIITPLEILTRRRPGYIRPAVPDWIPGLFMLFRTAAYDAISGFDERFFMYGEDFDVCARLQLAGWHIDVNEDLTALHDAQRTSHRRLKYLYWHASSLTKVWLSHTFWRYKRRRRFS
jgi:N-acetylglucosaminyl-diphospho-decaprenol L-rhamnosyltransferase